MRSAIAAVAPQWAKRGFHWLTSSRVRQDMHWERRRRLRGAPPHELGGVGRVLVICHGNICRSPFAGALLARRCPSLEVRSAGLEAQEAHPAEEAARRLARRWDLDLEAHAAHRMDARDAVWADLVLGMEGHHAVAVSRRWPGATRVLLLGDFLTDAPHRIEDPWGRDDATFTAVFERIEGAVEALARGLEAGGGAAPTERRP